MSRFLTPAWFLPLNGAVLVLLGLAGFILWGLLDLAKNAVFTISAGESVGHLAVGTFAMAISFWLRQRAVLLKWIVGLIGIAALFFAFYGVIGGDADVSRQRTPWAVADFERPIDNLLHLGFGLWAILSAFSPFAKIPSPKPHFASPSTGEDQGEGEATTGEP